MPDQSPAGRVVIAVLTYRRTHLLPALLAELVVQAGVAVPPATVLVIDNDPDGSAAPLVREWGGRGVRYVHEPRAGISAARNRALDEGVGSGAAALIFLDDDELPSPGWLGSLLGSWRAWGCSAVVGPVPPRFLGPVDPWVRGSGIFDRARRPTGTVVTGAGAGNLLLDLAQVRAFGLRFDERLGLTGGEDTMFVHQLVHRGGQIRWCDEAEAVEFIPTERLTRRWALQRSFRAGCSWSRAEVHLAGTVAARWRLRGLLTARAAARTTLASLEWLGGAARADVAARAHALCTVAGYAGLLAGSFGYVRAEYARTARTGTSAVPSAAPAEPMRAA